MTALSTFNLFAAVKGLSEEDKALFIEAAEPGVSESYFGSDYQQALGLLACHIAVMAQRDGGEAGALTGKREGDMSVSYSGDSLLTDDYGQTAPGMMLRRLILKHHMGEIVA